jgi:hypothetical protein
MSLKGNLDSDLVRMREAFLRPAEEASPREDCPEADRLWAAAHGELSTEERRQVVDHTAACPACSEAWRLAVEIGHSDEQVVVEIGRSDEQVAAALLPGTSSRWGLHRMAATVAAAVLAVAVVGVSLFHGRQEPQAPVYRAQPAEVSITNRVGDGEALPRDRFLLQWTASVPPETTFELTLMTEDLMHLTQIQGLSESAFQVPEEVLQDLPAEAVVNWQIKARLEDGRVFPSPIFEQIVR